MIGKKGVSFAQFFYRVNPDKTIDAICGYCLLTASTAASMADIHAREAAHKCWQKNGLRQASEEVAVAIQQSPSARFPTVRRMARKVGGPLYRPASSKHA
jgi:hypothetical protein